MTSYKKLIPVLALLVLLVSGCSSSSEGFGTSDAGVEEMSWSADLMAHSGRSDVPAVCIQVSDLYRCQFLARFTNSGTTPQEISGNFYLETKDGKIYESYGGYLEPIGLNPDQSKISYNTAFDIPLGTFVKSVFLAQRYDEGKYFQIVVEQEFTENWIN
jgi:hypothetical protein